MRRSRIYTFSILATAIIGAFACSRPLPEAPTIPINAFDEQNAFSHLKAFAALGPKTAGTEEALLAAKHIQAHLQAAGLIASIESFWDRTPDGSNIFHNILAELPGLSTPPDILVGCHFDTKAGIEGFIGANDSASGVGLMIELGRLMATHPEAGQRISLAFFDGEECLYAYSKHDGLHGSRHLARRLAAEGNLPRAVFIVDMIGDADLTVTIPRNCDPALTALIFRVAEAQGVRQYFRLARGNVVDDHLPFHKRRVPAVNLIDFQYGSEPGHNDYWHTPDDTLDKVSAESLGITARVLIGAINDLLAQTQPAP